MKRKLFLNAFLLGTFIFLFTYLSYGAKNIQPGTIQGLLSTNYIPSKFFITEEPQVQQTDTGFQGFLQKTIFRPLGFGNKELVQQVSKSEQFTFKSAEDYKKALDAIKDRRSEVERKLGENNENIQQIQEQIDECGAGSSCSQEKLSDLSRQLEIHNKYTGDLDLTTRQLDESEEKILSLQKGSVPVSPTDGVQNSPEVPLALPPGNILSPNNLAPTTVANLPFDLSKSDLPNQDYKPACIARGETAPKKGCPVKGGVVWVSRSNNGNSTCPQRLGPGDEVPKDWKPDVVKVTPIKDRSKITDKVDFEGLSPSEIAKIKKNSKIVHAAMQEACDKIGKPIMVNNAWRPGWCSGGSVVYHRQADALDLFVDIPGQSKEFPDQKEFVSKGYGLDDNERVILFQIMRKYGYKNTGCYGYGQNGIRNIHFSLNYLEKQPFYNQRNGCDPKVDADLGLACFPGRGR